MAEERGYEWRKRGVRKGVKRIRGKGKIGHRLYIGGRGERRYLEIG